MKFFDKYKRKLFPDIKDWSDPRDDLRYKKDWWKMGNAEFLLFSPLAYRWIGFGIAFAGSIMFFSLGYWSYTREVILLTIISIPMGLRMAWAAIQKARGWKNLNTLNFYDIIFREY